MSQTQLLKTLAITYAVVLCTSCTGTPKPKFVDVAELLCEGLDDFTNLHDQIINIHALIGSGDYTGALKVAYELVASFDESKDIPGFSEVRALIFLLESIVKGPKT